jgi:beta-glucosidase/6-phospho-beta-glucosidase/beta-galactosidase
MKIATSFVFLFAVFGRSFCFNDKFPDGFLFGVASSAYQIEGGYDSRGKASFDGFPATDSSNADIACDSYHLYQEDIGLLDNLGVDFYRFSIAWSRVLPSSYPHQVNPDAIRYYNALIDGLVAKNITPMVTMHHLDLPKHLESLGGWTNPLLVDLFVDYARILFENFGDRVKYWITFNANWIGYGSDFAPPQVNHSGIAEYLYVKNVLLAHAKVYHLYQEKFKQKQQAELGFTVDGKWYQAATDSPEDQEAATRAREFWIGVFANPFYGDGDFPKLVKQRVGQRSRDEGFSKSRLPELTQEEQELIRGSIDFFGVNIYTTFLVKDVPESDQREPSFQHDVRVKVLQDATWPGSGSSWLKVVPSGLRNVLNWINTKYHNPSIIITENGFSDKGEIHDQGRIDFYKKYLRALLEAIHEDGVKVKGYAVWSLLDNYEWIVGYSEKFGLHHVDFADPLRKRTPKSSALWYKKLLERRRLDEPSEIRLEL